eukprot:1314082-Rhodomonas_salina.1
MLDKEPDSLEIFMLQSPVKTRGPAQDPSAFATSVFKTPGANKKTHCRSVGPVQPISDQLQQYPQSDQQWALTFMQSIRSRPGIKTSNRSRPGISGEGAGHTTIATSTTKPNLTHVLVHSDPQLKPRPSDSHSQRKKYIGASFAAAERIVFGEGGGGGA